MGAWAPSTAAVSGVIVPESGADPRRIYCRPDRPYHVRASIYGLISVIRLLHAADVTAVKLNGGMVPEIKLGGLRYFRPKIGE
jgi:hypothetical protein